MNDRIYLNNDWQFTPEYTDKLLAQDFSGELTPVRIPHTVKELPFHYFSEKEYQMVSGYRRSLHVPAEWQGKILLLTFEGAAHRAEVFVNGVPAGEHACGYTAFTLDISKLVTYGADNLITVRLDSRESLNVPPFGFVIDYLTYGGIYRDVYLEVKGSSYIEDIFVRTDFDCEFEEHDVPVRQESATVISEILVHGATDHMTVRQSLRKKGETRFRLLGEGPARTILHPLKAGIIDLWNVDGPNLYELKTELCLGKDILDEHLTTFGFRHAEFTKDAFLLNGKRLKIRGLNRHQSYAYAGYAMPDAPQREDARILKEELGLNAVRTSHYPQSHAFVDACDELGLLVFTEIPGWQHIGDDEWKAQAAANVKDMVLQYRNHPSIFMWGVRINESVDDDALYKRTNALAHALDPTRPTGGVRCYKKGSFLEDVFTYNDFVHKGDNKGCEKKSDVTSDTKRPYLISEYNGHMFPTKPFDSEEHTLEHALRHANVLDEVAKQQDICGSFGWCMFDYNTHKDFGSGDRICYHGVMDMFRNPKLAASIYASQQDRTPVLTVSSSMDIGEHPGSNRGDIYIITNADSVKMYRNDLLIKEYAGEDSPYKHLAHGPILIDDYIGDQLITKERMPEKKAEVTRDLLNQVARKGLYSLNKAEMARAFSSLLRYRMKPEDAVSLYNRYIGDWGGEATTWKFEAYKDGKIVKTLVLSPMSERRLEVLVDHTDLVEGKSYDVASVRIRLTDEFGNVLPFANDPVVLNPSGEIQLIGPSVISLSGGMGGTYVRTTGREGEGHLLMFTPEGDRAEISFSIMREGK